MCSPAKDVDGFSIANAGRLATGQGGLVPCTPLGCLMLLKEQLGDLAGLNAVVVGKSNIVGKPMAQLLLAENCTVTVVHSRTRNLAQLCRIADVLVAPQGAQASSGVTGSSLARRSSTSELIESRATLESRLSSAMWPSGRQGTREP